MAGGLVIWAATALGLPQPESLPLPELSPAVRTLLAQDYLTPAERASLRLRHGSWEEGDLASPAARAQAALMRGAWGDAVFQDDTVPALDRAEAALNRGEPELSLRLCEGLEEARARRVRGEALLDLGRPDEAKDALRQAGSLDGTSVEEIVEACRARIVLARLEPAAGGARLDR